MAEPIDTTAIKISNFVEVAISQEVDRGGAFLGEHPSVYRTDAMTFHVQADGKAYTVIVQTAAERKLALAAPKLLAALKRMKAMIYKAPVAHQPNCMCLHCEAGYAIHTAER